MIGDKKIVVVMPAYNAQTTLRSTVAEVDRSLVDEIVLVDDASGDETAKLAEELDLVVYRHDRNKGYGGNQKSCYRLALTLGADVVVMLHPDYQYTPKLLPALAHMVASGVYDVALGSRIIGKGALPGGMPRYKYVANRALTFFQNLLLREKLSEYHTGYRAFSRLALARLPFEGNSDDFVFDNEILCQAIAQGLRIGEISCPTRYFAEASSIDLYRSIRYGLGVTGLTFRLVLHRLRLRRDRFFDPRRPRVRRTLPTPSRAAPGLAAAPPRG